MPRLKYKGHVIEYVFMGEIPDFEIYDMPIDYPIYKEFYEEVSREVFGIEPVHYRSSIGDLFPNHKQQDPPDAIFHFEESVEDKLTRLSSGYSHEEIQKRWTLMSP